MELSVDYDGPDIEPGTTIIWRVDAFGQSGMVFTIEGNDYVVDSGSESEERYIYIQ